MKILVVEDDNVSRLLLMTKLRKLGYSPEEACDGEEGWNKFVQDEPGLVITDWMMPELDGLQLCRRIRGCDREHYAYIIMLTALVGKKNYLEGMSAGADDFINKPVDMEELTARLHVAERILSLQKEVKQLEGLLPICAYCKNIRDDNDVWHPIEGYVSSRTEATFTHGYCPSCFEQHVKPQLEEFKAKRRMEKEQRDQLLQP